MKKIAILMVAVAAVVMTACNGNPSASLKNEADSLSYALGVDQGSNLKPYMSMRLGLDTALIDKFLEGFLEGAKLGNDSAAIARMEGVKIGQQIGVQYVKYMNSIITGNDSVDYVVVKNMLAGFCDGAKGEGSMTVEYAKQYADSVVRALHAKQMAVEFADNKKAGEEFMAQVAAREGIQSLGDGVYYEVVTQGEGEVAKPESKVTINYVGKMIDGSEFESRNGVKSVAGQFIKGFTKALTTMPVGSKWIVYIPQDQAYGAEQAGRINPYSALIFELELVSIDE